MQQSGPSHEPRYDARHESSYDARHESSYDARYEPRYDASYDAHPNLPCPNLPWDTLSGPSAARSVGLPDRPLRSLRALPIDGSKDGSKDGSRDSGKDNGKYGDEVLSESLAGLVHDARNMVSTMNLYCDLLEQPAVLSEDYRSYAADLRLVAIAGERLLDKLALVVQSTGPDFAAHASQASLQAAPAYSRRLPSSLRSAYASVLPGIAQPSQYPTPEAPARIAPSQVSPELRYAEIRQIVNLQIVNLAAELRTARTLLSALAGPGVTVGLTLHGGGRPLSMNRDDLTRILVNLVRNAAEAMHGKGHIQIILEESAEFLTLSVADNGPGIPARQLETLFTSAYGIASRQQEKPDAAGADPLAWPVRHRGLGLSIVRSIVVTAGGSLWAVNRGGSGYLAVEARAGELFQSGAREAQSSPTAGKPPDEPEHGAIFLMEFPLARLGAAT